MPPISGRRSRNGARSSRLLASGLTELNHVVARSVPIVPSPACGGGRGRGQAIWSSISSHPHPSPPPQPGEGADRAGRLHRFHFAEIRTFFVLISAGDWMGGRDGVLIVPLV